MQIVPFTGNREFIVEHLSRAKRFHCPCTAVFEYDVTDLVERIAVERAAGRAVGLTALLVRATTVVMERHPRMNHHLFRRWFRWVEVAFDQISCTLIVQRDAPGGEEVLFPLLLRDTARMSIEDIHAAIKHHKTVPMSELPQMAAFNRIKKMPWWLIKLFSYRARSSPSFYAKYFGSYGISSMVSEGWGGIGGHVVANTAAGFVPGAIRSLPRVVDGEIQIRKVMTMGLVFDHFLLDGRDVMAGMSTLRELLETPVLLEESAGSAG